MIKSRTWLVLIALSFTWCACSNSLESSPDMGTNTTDLPPAPRTDLQDSPPTDTGNTDLTPQVPLLTHPIISLEGTIEEGQSPQGKTTYSLGDLACDIPCAYPFGADLFGSIPNIGFEYRVKPQSPVRAAVSAKVVFKKTNMPSSNDMEIHMKTSDDSPYVLIYDHIGAPTVDIGDTVVAGQMIGKAGNWDASHGTIELQINYEDPDSSDMWAVCPVELGSDEFNARHELWLEVHNLSAPSSSHPGFHILDGLCQVDKRFP